jgi:hypothetical protein
MRYLMLVAKAQGRIFACHPQEPDLSRLQDGYTTTTTDQWYFKRAANDSNQSHLIFTDVQAGYS